MATFYGVVVTLGENKLPTNRRERTHRRRIKCQINTKVLI